MSHHVSASPTNPTGAVEVVRVSNSAATTAPVDGGSAAGAGTSTPVSTVATPAAGQSSGTPGANLPVPDIEQASTTIQGARADLARTAGAERRLDGFDGVGGGGGGGGENANADVAAGTANQNVSDQQGGLSEQRQGVGERAAINTTADQNANQSDAQNGKDPRSVRKA